MPGRAELAVHPGGGDFGQKELIHVSPHVAVPELGHLGVDLVQGGDNLVQHQRCGDFEDGVVHVLGVGAALVPVEVLDEGEHLLLHHGVHLPGGEVVEYRPLELIARDSPLPNLDLLPEHTFVGQAQHGALLGAQIVCLIQIVDEHQVGHLLHHVQRVGNAARPEDLPEGVDLVFQFACNHSGSLFLVFMIDHRISGFVW